MLAKLCVFLRLSSNKASFPRWLRCKSTVIIITIVTSSAFLDVRSLPGRPRRPNAIQHGNAVGALLHRQLHMR